MKVVAFNGSPHPNGNTAQSLKIVLAGLEKEGIETELVQVGGKILRGCTACGMCGKTQDLKCAYGDDGMNTFIRKMYEADGILIGSPVYFGNVTSETKALIDRCGYVSRRNGFFLKRKVGAPVIAARRAGTNFTYAAINYFFGIMEMIIPCSSYWNMTLSDGKQTMQEDKEGVETFKTLGQNMAWLLKKTVEK